MRKALKYAGIMLLGVVLMFGFDAGASVLKGGGLSETAAGNLYCKLAACTMTGTLTSSVASGSNAIAFSTNGARLDLGDGSTDYFTSNGTTIIAAGAFQAIGNATLATVNINNQMRNNTSTNICTSSGAASSALCTLDDAVFDGIIYMEETTTPTAEANYGAIYTKSTNKLFFQDGAGVEHELTEFETFHGEAGDNANTDAFGVAASADEHCYHSNAFVGGDLAGFTFDTGGAGTSFPIASVADGLSGEIAVTTTGSHGLAQLDIVSHTNITAAYTGIFIVNSITSDTVYEVTAVFGSTSTGTMDQCASIIVATGSAGDYHLAWSASATTATNNETFDFDIHIGATDTGTEVREKFGTGSDFSSLGGVAIITLADADRLSFTLVNTDSAGDITIRNLSLVITRL